MAVRTSQIHKITDEIAQNVLASYKGLSLYFTIHRFGKLRESIALSEHEIVMHPAGKSARAIIRKHTSSEKSSFLGLAIEREKKMLGFKHEDHLLGLFNINLDEYENEDDARAHIYHLAWHAIDLYDIRQQPQYTNKFKNGPMVPKRSDMNLAKACLQADAFAIALSYLKNEGDLIPLLSKKRALDAFEKNSNHKPENFPSVITMEACKLAISDLSTDIPANRHVKEARRLSIEIGHAFDEENIRQWWNFTIPAQDMAWRGFSKEHILSAAVHTSSDAFVRSVAYLVQDVTGLEFSSPEILEKTYNAFIDPDVLLTLHKEMVDTVFENAITQGLEESSNRSFLNAANKLNESLTDGQILGWCSNALQDAAQAFERALLNGAPPDQAARMQFEGNKNHPKWSALKKLGQDIIDQKRQGFAITMGHLAEICNDNPAFSPVLNSLKVTMNDPGYIQKLEAANDYNIVPTAPVPSAPAPKGPAPQAPTMAPSLAPSLGGSGSNRGQQIARQQQLMAQKRLEEQNGSGDHQT